MAALTQIWSIVGKDLRQLLRNKSFVYGIIFFEILFNLLYPCLVTYQLRNISVSVVDYDCSVLSAAIVRDIRQTDSFSFVGIYATHEDAVSVMNGGRLDCILEIPSGFEAGLDRMVFGRSIVFPRIHLTTNAINTTKAIPSIQNVSGCVAQTVRNYAMDKGLNIPQVFDGITVINAYNPFNEYKNVMLPIIFLCILFCFNTPARLMANEYEYGTIDQINVSPVNTLSLMTAKVMANFIACFVVILLSMVCLWLVYGFRPEGSILLLLLTISLFIVSSSCLTLILCNRLIYGAQMVMYSSILALISEIVSGYFTPFECMAEWVQKIACIFPSRYVVYILRSICLKGCGMADLGMEFVCLTGLSAVYFILSVLTCRKSHS